MLSENEICDIVDKIVIYYDPDKIILFGSYAKGCPSEQSDIDLLVIKNSNLPRHMRGKEVKQLFYGSMILLDFHFYTNYEIEELQKESLSFISSVIKSGKIIYSKQKLITDRVAI